MTVEPAAYPVPVYPQIPTTDKPHCLALLSANDLTRLRPSVNASCYLVPSLSSSSFTPPCRRYRFSANLHRPLSPLPTPLHRFSARIHHNHLRHHLGVSPSILDSINVSPQLKHAHNLAEGTARQRSLSELALRRRTPRPLGLNPIQSKVFHHHW